MYGAVKTGSLTAGFAILALILYTVNPNDNVSVFFSLSLGRLYSISMLANLNARHSNDDNGRAPSSGGEASSGQGESRRSKGGRSTAKMSKTKGIKITSEVVTRIDDADIDLEEGNDVIQLSGRRATEKVRLGLRLSSRSHPVLCLISHRSSPCRRLTT